MNKYTIIGEFKETGKIFVAHIDANNSYQAMFFAAKSNPTVTISAAFSGHLTEGNGMELAGESVVDAETILEQEDIFNSSDPEEKPDEVTLADITLKQWQEDAYGEDWGGPKEHTTPYRMTISQSSIDNRVSFKIYPLLIDSLQLNTEFEYGLSGFIEIHEGRPGLSVGIHEDRPTLHIETNHSGLFLHTDQDIIPENKSWASYSHNKDFEGLYYKLDNGVWLENARRKIAEKVFEDYDFSKFGIVSAHNGWLVSSNSYNKAVFFENENGGDSLKGDFSLTFADNSIALIEVSSS